MTTGPFVNLDGLGSVQATPHKKRLDFDHTVCGHKIKLYSESMLLILTKHLC